MNSRLQKSVRHPRHTFQLLLLLFVFATQSACTGLLTGLLGGGVSAILQAVATPAAPSAPGSTGTGGTGTGAPASGATDDGDDDDGSVVDTGDDDNDVLPQASIPLPPGLQNSSLSALSENGDMTAQGNLGTDAADLALVISRVPLELSGSAKNNHNVLPEMSVAYASTDDCPDGDYVACTDVADDGSFEVTFGGVNEDDLLYYYLYDPESEELSEPTEETVNTNLVYVGNDLQTVTGDGTGTLYGLSDDGKFVKISYDSDDSTLRVSGDSGDKFVDGEIGMGASQVVYSDGKFVIVTDSNASEFSDDGSGNYTPTGKTTDLTCSSSYNSCTPKSLKLVDGNMYYGATFSADTYDTGRIFEFYDDAADGFEFMAVTFVPSDTDAHSNSKKLHAYDVYTDSVSGFKTAITVLETQDDKIRLYGKVQYTDDYYPTNSFVMDSAYTEILDLVVIEQQTDDDDTDGRGGFLSNVGLTFFDFDNIEYVDGATGFELGPDVSISNATAMATNSSKSVAYVLSTSDDSIASDDIITVVDLMDEAATPTTLALTDYLDGKTATDLSPKSITYFSQGESHFLLVTLGCDDDAFKNTAIVIPLE